ncbi:MAG TPA: hypothetical protein VN715_12950 [Roseiarcus sp.]|nr:hypothetical protein [Roseiarcus sp.]
MTSADIPASRSTLADALATPRAVGVIYAALVALSAAPVALWPIPRGNDIVNHWARLTLYHMAPGDPLRALYRVHLGLIPNLGLDALYLALSPLLSAQTVVRLALALAIALPAFGAWRLHRRLFARPSPTIFVIPLMSYNLATTGGLLNFALGMGLALIGLGFVLRLGERLRARDYAMLNLFGAALFFCHLIAWGAFALLMGLARVETLRAPPRRIAARTGEAVLAQALPLALVLLRPSMPSTYELGGAKSAMLLAPVASATASDLPMLILLVGVAALALVRGLSVAPRARLALAGFALVALIAPPAHGAANLIDARLAVYVWYFAVAATALRTPAGLGVPAALAATVLTAARLYAVTPAWEAFQDRAASVRAGLTALPPGARALVVALDRCGDADYAMFPNLTAFAVIDRRAYVNTLFAQSGIQPVAPADPALDGGPTLAMDPRWLSPAGRAALPAHMLNAPWAAAFRDWRRHFSHVIDAHGGCASTLDAPGLTRIGGAAGLDVYRID